jgi:hypothetical protein
VVTFSTTGEPGLVRPAQPSDTRAVPVIVDPQTAASAGPGGRLDPTIDGIAIRARVIGVLKRFPTVPASAAGFVLADEATLASALDAQAPGQGRPDELWISTEDPTRLRAALRKQPLAQLTSTFRADLERQLRDAPTAQGVLGTLIAAAALAGALAVLGLLTALLGAGRDPRLEDDLAAQGIGPGDLRLLARGRIGLAAACGVLAGLGIAVLLTSLAVATVRAAGAVSNPQPGLVTVVPWVEIGVWCVGAAILLTAAGWAASIATMRDRPARRTEGVLITEGDGTLSEGLAR